MRPQRIHPNFPTYAEARESQESVWSDHSPILMQFPLSDQGGDNLNIISLNMLGESATDSGLHKVGEGEKWENREQCIGRYRRIAAFLKNAAQTYNAEILGLQEMGINRDSNPWNIVLLQEVLGEEWEVLAHEDKRFGIITCYKKDRFQLQDSQSIYKRVGQRVDRAFSMQLKVSNSGKIINVSNVWYPFSSSPVNQENFIREQLSKSDSDCNIAFGDWNNRVIPLPNQLSEHSVDLSTGAIPPTAIQLNLKNQGQEVELENIDYQQSDFPDGGFYRLAEGGIRQVQHQVLQFVTGEIFQETRQKDEMQSCPDYRMAIAVDGYYQETPIIGEKTIFGYERAMRDVFGDQNILVRPASKSVINSDTAAIGIRFSPNSPLFTKLSQKLSSNQSVGSESEDIFDQGSQSLMPTLFVPQNKVELLHNEIMKEAFAVSCGHLANELSQSGGCCSFFHREKKAQALSELMTSIQQAEVGKSLQDVIREWKAVDNGSGSNYKIIMEHRGPFAWLKNLIGLSTTTSEFVDSLQNRTTLASR